MRQLGKEKENSEFKPVKLYLKNDLESYPARAEGLVNMILFVDFSKAFDSTHRENLEQILLAYGQPKETVDAILMLYQNTKIKEPSPGGDTDYFDIVTGVLQGDKLAPYLFIICLEYVLRTSIDKMLGNIFKLAKERSRSYHKKLLRTRTTPMI